jgi:hypothetical protein
MKKRTFTTLSFLILPVLAGCGVMPAAEAKWDEVKVIQGNFAVECPDDRVLDSDDESTILICRGAGADYSVLSGVFDSGDDATSEAAVLRDAREDIQASRDKIFVNETVERNGRTVQEAIGLEKSSTPPTERNSVYEMLKSKEKLLVFERSFYADKRMITLTVHYEAPSDPNAYQQVLDKNKEKRERFFNSFRFLEDKKAAQ